MTALVASIMGNLGILIADICVPYGNRARINSLTAEESLRTEVSHQKRIYYGNLVSNLLSLPNHTAHNHSNHTRTILIGVPLYIKYSPKKEMTELKNALFLEILCCRGRIDKKSGF